MLTHIANYFLSICSFHVPAVRGVNFLCGRWASDNNRTWFFCGTFSSMERGTPTHKNRKTFSSSKSVLLAGKIIDGDLREANWKYSNVLSDHFQQAFFSSFLFSFLIRWRIDFKSFENKTNLKTSKNTKCPKYSTDLACIICIIGIVLFTMAGLYNWYCVVLIAGGSDYTAAFLALQLV